MKKKQLLEIVKQLSKTNEQCESTQIRYMAEFEELLMNCQNAAIALGTQLETQGEAGEYLMHFMEEYCEYIYQLGANAGEEQAFHDTIQQISQLLTRVEEGITYDLPADKREVVFFPYNASMWDSLESAWKKAKEDENCEVYVVPIPYCDRKPDGTVKKWYYEGDKYPDYVPITYWENYHVEEREPDVAYIHNPYDEHNYVTSVHPKFYSSELKKHVGELIYIPYFVVIDKVEEHFVTVPAVINADKVILESEKVRESYIEIFIKFAGRNQAALEEQIGVRNEDYWKQLEQVAREKFVVAESGKYTKLEETKRENVEIPPQWEKLMHKADGTTKKVLFYNTSLETLLKNRDTYMQKICSVLAQLQQQDDVLLLWRPHPLMQSTLDAMIPQLAEEYRQIVEEYKTQGWGIYDDTADLHRAIAISDAYYGDWSSVVAMYKETGKPIMIQNLEIVY